MGFTPGPEQKPWDGLMGYPTVHGVAYVDGTVIASWQPDDQSGCPGVARYAIANHAKAPDAFHPHYFSNTHLETATVSDANLLKVFGPNPGCVPVYFYCLYKLVE
jgi:hypothetical protein